MTQDPSCLFCKIIDGKVPCTKVFENENVLAFKDIYPQAPIHYLFIPKQHVESLAHLPKEQMNIMSDLYEAIQEVTVKEGFSKKGYKTTIHTGKGGGQVIFHLHVHLMAQA